MIAAFLTVTLCTLVASVAVGIASAARDPHPGRPARMPGYDDADCWPSDLPGDVRTHDSTVTRD